MAIITENGWADDRMMTAYDLLWEVWQANKELGIDPEFTGLLASIEAVSGIIVGARKEAA